MKQILRSNDRGLADHGWLKSRHTFSFAEFYNPERMGFRNLRVINEDRIAGGTGFPKHGHRDMEIVSYVIDGELAHRDSMGNEVLIRPGEVQRMRAGSGVTHSEYNALKDRSSHFLQIWIIPDERGLEPGYGQKSFVEALSSGRQTLVASKDGRDGSIEIATDADLYIARPTSAQTFEVRPKRYVWVQMIRGEVKVGGETLSAGDALSVTTPETLKIEPGVGAEYLLFDLA